jgi:short-subunit dehydrogenase
MDYDFKDKTVIITGGSEGVGAATARKFAEHGANLVLVARSKRNLDRIAEELREKTRVEIVAMDVSDTDACVNLFKKAEFEFGDINILVNNAGYHERGLVESVSVEDLSAMIDVNLKAPIIMCKLAIKYLKQAGGGAIINVASLAGRTPVPRAATYSATKFGLRAFTFALGEELRGSDIKIAAVSPGPIDTGFIMSNIDDVTDVTFSQPMSTADEVAQEILNLTANTKRERSMPPISGLLTTTMYLFPWLGRLVLPLMIRKGRNVKRKLKARMRQMEEEQGG